ncbi:ester cyclase [Halomicroarcula sp. F28]|uniref:ester cyclase n=1 Tax=Haloarcula salinisoli TaxID=2487746 RepID=UPI001C734A59|nr:ester cyclase [Halomicroarcula salinisoli]MBX0285796.1 ester cyclase [Halomicroarcula salinisoli]
MSRAERVRRVERVFEAFNDHDTDGIVAEMAPEGTFTDPFQDEPLAKAEFHEMCVGFFDVFPDARWERERVIGGEDSTVAVQATLYGTFEESLEHVPPTGESLALPTVSLFTMSEAGITTWRDYWDLATFKRQLGISFPAVLGHLPRMLRWKLRAL